MVDVYELPHAMWDRDFNMLKCPMIDCNGSAEKFNEVYLALDGLVEEWKEMVLTKSGVPSKDHKGARTSNFERNKGSKKIWTSPGQVRVMWIGG